MEVSKWFPGTVPSADQPGIAPMTPASGFALNAGRKYPRKRLLTALKIFFP